MLTTGAEVARALVRDFVRRVVVGAALALAALAVALGLAWAVSRWSVGPSSRDQPLAPPAHSSGSL